ncbi:hypothetical protein NWP96_01535 [Mycoplasmopsis cynos]|nr:hypothetical protein [Mycoplasmopsis cynos]
MYKNSNEINNSFISEKEFYNSENSVYHKPKVVKVQDVVLLNDSEALHKTNICKIEKYLGRFIECSCNKQHKNKETFLKMLKRQFVSKTKKAIWLR